ncbi:hypothetical protein BS47DRAFT_1393828 [Hydnum rufescens UP504]|uniref:Uncharacterized protein n=1 Tax=Hydnum rufescens UP504 TaxID=1448309 RepID=A0A9P6DVR5_9AGAM|nr:hypothetical protein BS47DRAFT_1393828 [Hydnum rufescens UP504]
MAGNPIAIACPPCSANDLQPYATLIAEAIFPPGDGTQITLTEVKDEIAMNVTEFPSFICPLPTRWLIAADKIPQSNSTSLTSQYEEHAPKRDPKSASTQYNNNQAPHQPAPENGIEIDDQVWTPPHAERKRKLSENAEVRRQRPPPDT